MLAASETHWAATFAAIYFLLLPTMFISLLFIIIQIVLLFLPEFGCYAKYMHPPQLERTNADPEK